MCMLKLTAAVVLLFLLHYLEIMAMADYVAFFQVTYQITFTIYVMWFVPC